MYGFFLLACCFRLFLSKPKILFKGSRDALGISDPLNFQVDKIVLQLFKGTFEILRVLPRCFVVFRSAKPSHRELKVSLLCPSVGIN